MNAVTVRIFVTLAVCAVTALGLGGCDDGDDAPPCGPGERVENGCVFGGNLIIEGFLCPETAPYRHDFEDEVACTEGEDLSSSFLEAMSEAGYVAAPIGPASTGDTCPRDGAATGAADGCNTCTCSADAWACTDEPSCGGDPCAAVELPTCPGECAAGVMPGQACETEGEACGNTLGDGCVCQDSAWECTVHAPLSPDGCNLVCRESEVDCAVVGCAMAPICGVACDQPCGCCACGEGDTREVEVDSAVVVATCDASQGCFELPSDPCDGLALPACPTPCDGSQSPGVECPTDGEVCGNDIGDGCTCTAGTWECTVHAPLSPGECNLVCRG